MSVAEIVNFPKVVSTIDELVMMDAEPEFNATLAAM